MIQSINLEPRLKEINTLISQILTNQDYIKEQNNFIISKLKSLEQVIIKQQEEFKTKDIKTSHTEIISLLGNIENIISS